jgi:hypothetical protein
MSEDNTLTGELEDQKTINSISDAATTEQEVKDYFEQLVGEEKKYKSPQDLAKAYVHADLHIQELRDKLDDIQSNDSMLQEVLAELRKKPTPPTDHAPAPTPATADRSKDVDIEEVVTRKLSERQALEKAKSNREKSLTMLDQHFGDRSKALAAVRAKIDGNTVIEETINRLGDSFPEELFKYVTGESPGADNTSETGQPNIPGMGDRPSAHILQQSSGSLTWKKCQELRKKDPKAYNSPEFRAKMEQAVANHKSQGKDFFST